MSSLIGRQTELKKPGPLVRLLYLVIAGAPIVEPGEALRVDSPSEGAVVIARRARNQPLNPRAAASTPQWTGRPQKRSPEAWSIGAYLSARPTPCAE